MELGPYKRLVRMIWDPEPIDDTTAGLPLCCLGTYYSISELSVSQNGRHSAHVSAAAVSTPNRVQTTPDVDDASAQDAAVETIENRRSPDCTPPNDDWPSGFLDDLESRIWMTYRSDFPPIPRSTDPKALSTLSLAMRIKTQLKFDTDGFSSDSGWGCMIRSGQGLLANALLIQQLGRDWRRGCSPLQERTLLAKFADDPRAPYSIHSFVSRGAQACGKFPGEWFGPSATANCIQYLVGLDKSSPFKVFSTGGSPHMSEEAFLQVARPSSDTFVPTLVLVDTRLGTDKINPAYWDGVLASLQMPQSVGIAGGRPSSSHYFVGTQGNFLYYLDPHFTRPTLPYREDAATYSDAEVESCHTKRLRRLHIKDLDPSMLIGFLIRDAGDWNDWKSRLATTTGMAPVNVLSQQSDATSSSTERAGAIDEVQSLSDEDEVEHMSQ